MASLALCACLLGGCAAERETTLLRAARQREVGELRAERHRLQQEMGVLTRTVGEQESALALARRQDIATGAELRTALVSLEYELGRLQRAEQDLAATRARAQQIEVELAPLRALEATLRDQERLQAEAAAKLATLQAEVETASKQAAAQEAELLPRLQALVGKLAALKQLGVTLTAAEAEIGKALAAVLPPTPAAPAPNAGAPEPKK